MYLFDTSVWIDFLKNHSSSKTELLETSLSDFEVATCPTLFQEILQGIKNQKHYEEVYLLLHISTKKLGNDPFEAATGAAQIYRSLRQTGISIRKPNDCLIAWYCIENDLELVHNDVDFTMIAKHFPLKTWEGNS